MANHQMRCNLFGVIYNSVFTVVVLLWTRHITSGFWRLLPVFEHGGCYFWD